MNTNSADEMMSSMKAFNKEFYHKSEILSEMLKLENEIVALTFNEEHAATANLKMWDVEKHFKDLNEQCGGIVNQKLEKFIGESKEFCNLIKAEISGQRGELKAFSALEYLKSKNIVLKNVELASGDLRTEIDAIVINPAGLTIVEVKNTSKDIFIDECGGYYRMGTHQKWDCNILKKMNLRETLLKEKLEEANVAVPNIRHIVVFTDNRIEVHNRCKEIRTCFISQLAYFIDDYRETSIFTDGIMEQLETVILEASSREIYPFSFDVDEFKRNFVDIMLTLEDASSKVDAIEKIDCKSEERMEETAGWGNRIRALWNSKYVKYAGQVAAYVLMPIASGIIATTIIRKGEFTR